MRRYDRALLRRDLIAGATVGMVAVPSSLAMAELAGLPVVYGLYGTLFPLAVYGLLATSRQHGIGPDATLASLTAVTIAPLAVDRLPGVGVVFPHQDQQPVLTRGAADPAPGADLIRGGGVVAGWGVGHGWMSLRSEQWRAVRRVLPPASTM